MIIKNANIRNKEGLWDILIQEKIIVKISRDIDSSKYDKETVVDVDGSLVLPPFVEPHIHLDTTLTAGEPSWNISGTLFEGIERWSERKQLLTHEDVKKRALKALSWQMANGIQYVRTHVDVTDPELTALKAMIEVKEEIKDFITLQIVAFPQEGILSYPKGLDLIQRSIELGVDVLGAIPHFEFTREYGVQSIEKIIELAQKNNCLIDVHCDEIDDEQSRFIEVLATKAYENNMGDKVTASHTTAMGSYNDAYTSKLFRILKLSKINFVSNPLVNIHLQGRFDSYPKRRGVTRVKELLNAGINVSLGHDDILDPWYPLGTGNMLQVLHMGLHVSQLMGYEEIKNSIDMITKNSAKALCIKDYGIEEGNTANLIVLSAKDEYDAIRTQATIRYSIRNGNIISETLPSTTFTYTNGIKNELSFKL